MVAEVLILEKKTLGKDGQNEMMLLFIDWETVMFRGYQSFVKGPQIQNRLRVENIYRQGLKSKHLEVL